MIKYVKFQEVRKDIIKMMQRKSLIPVIGAGFTKGCVSRRDRVPSGEEYYKYMIAQIVGVSSVDMEEELKKESFSSVSSIYHKVVNEEKRYAYLRDCFTNVKLDKTRKEFLQIEWPYVYTLNIDDGIENNSAYNTVLYANREIRNTIFDENKCLIKLHGDIKDILSYKDSKCEIFDQKQYVVSIKSNSALLKRLTHDYEFLNLIYIGCGLTDEIDLLFSTAIAHENANVRYYCTIERPSMIQQMKLEDFGITHCIMFDNYAEIYEALNLAYNESLEIMPDDLKPFSRYEFRELEEGFDINKAYLFQGKSLLDSSGMTIYPHFFVSREEIDRIVRNTNKKGTQIIIGSGCSGKTYLAFDVVKRVRDKEVYLFRSRDRINSSTFELLLKRENSLIICDSKVLSFKQIEKILYSNNDRLKINNSFLVLEGKSNRDLYSILDYMKKRGELKKQDILQYGLANKLSKKKTGEINKLLVKSSLGLFDERKTIADNIIHASELLIHDNRFCDCVPCMSSVREVASLIALATMEKLYASDAVYLDLVEELEKHCKTVAPLIEKESTWNFEISASNNSPMKYVVNAEYWLYKQLDRLSHKEEGRMIIIEAYKYIVGKLIMVFGEPHLMKHNRNAAYKDYILFDNIFQIFYSQDTTIIREIYEGLSGRLSTDPNYLHQRAKCYVRSAYRAEDDTEKEKWLKNAYRDASISNDVFEKRYNECGNEKVMISAAHSLYTAALALCHIARIRNYEDVSINNRAIELLYGAFESPFNSVEFVNSDKMYNYNDVVNDVITTFATNKKYMNDESSENKVSELIRMFMSNN